MKHNRQLDVACETKTKDNVFVNVNVSVQFQVKEDKIYEAYYELSDTESQIRAYVFDTVRSILPTMELDQAFEAKEELAIGVQDALKETMESYGYKIIQALITDLTPDTRVKNAMNEINASRRLKESNVERAEGEKIQIVKAAEAGKSHTRDAASGHQNPSARNPQNPQCPMRHYFPHTIAVCLKPQNPSQSTCRGRVWRSSVRPSWMVCATPSRTSLAMSPVQPRRT